MDVVADQLIMHWLVETWSGELGWDDGNSPKLKKHNATEDGIDYLFTTPEAEAFLIGKIQPPAGEIWSEPRYLTFGVDINDKPRAVIWTTRRAKIRPISCRIMRANERKHYESLKETHHLES
jgi:uncharacterized DUF497 family protein